MMCRNTFEPTYSRRMNEKYCLLASGIDCVLCLKYDYTTYSQSSRCFVGHLPLFMPINGNDRAADRADCTTGDTVTGFCIS